ncbi:MAG: ATP-binding protein [Thalassospira sp.]|uniref:sensor histidine kinase n=1 Tax=Thalassospira sp. TaxID=1912094 RepID=UPI0032EFCD24
MKLTAQNSLQFTLTKRLTIIVVLFWIIGAIFAAYTARHEMEEGADTALIETSHRTATLVLDYLITHQVAGEILVMPEPAFEIVFGVDGDDDGDDDVDDDDFMQYQLRNRAGDVLLRSQNAPDTPFDAPLVAGFANSDNLRVYTSVTTDGALFMQVAEPTEHRTEAIIETVVSQFTPLIFLVPITILAIVYGISRGLAPVRQVLDEIEARGEGNLSPIVQDDPIEEIHTIVAAVNRLMGKLEAALSVERSFTANSAHELRTPIAVALAQTQRLVLELPQDHPVQKRALQTEAALKRLSRLSEKLLQLARAEAGVGSSPTGENQKLGATLALVIEDIKRAGADGGVIDFDPATADVLEANIDQDAFAICMRNLIENALKHGGDEEPVKITIRGSDTICVSNGGAPVSAKDLSDLKARFKRSNSKADGSGLGLAIVETIVRNTNGTLTLYSPRPDKADGFEAELRLHQS